MVAQRVRGVVFVAMLGLCLVTHAGIVGSEHDFSSKGWSGGKICEVCHTPHNADTTVTAAPLWNHQTTTATYILYSSSTLDATPTQPDHYGSKLCLSCHDGTVALDSFGGATGSTFITGNAHIGTDLRGTHPIGIVYDSALAAADKGLFDPSSKTTALGGSITRDLLFNTGNLECASCHDVHNSQNTGGNLLRITSDGSALCLTCHNK
ncbi:MAG TPA: cytochrome c3 family protein [Planctomycetota bacterium]|nr:cytochrome c3 family protein [Planctomycetota bacterium]HRR79287.1 cytochrome c3 family protein [Planctomycetota bacterium]HRT96870.1 cytochrome c3 family protein [Planctomycetota bacterium]